ncbi:hypothetical protein PFNF54_04061 [Plasmodium falciparum NF54]|uniref:Uncharacterized protein n=1 Tax=Plasmodium falciparum (isolate NF54) TaxID=5843 RepID=W7JQY3_PLAFO|nr:hypothetical protein PFNF54_04061 [Plasmodium falciparum NF54]
MKEIMKRYNERTTI